MKEHFDCEAFLKKSGFKYTKQREAILHTFEDSKRPVTAEDVYMELKKQGVPVNLSTVYRTLEMMTDKNLLQKFGIPGDARMFFAPNCTGHRHYLVCMGCKKILPIEHCPLAEYEKALAKETSYTISGHSLDIFGYCPDCQACTHPDE